MFASLQSRAAAARERWDEAGVGMRAAVGSLAVVATAGLLALLTLVALGRIDPFGPGQVDVNEIAAAAGSTGSEDPLAYDDDRRELFERRATVGLEHVLFAKSPDGVIKSAERTAAFRDQVEAAAARSGADPDLMEAIVFLESAGRPEVIAGNDPAAASGLAQIVASTGISLLEMRVDLPRSQQLSAEIAANATKLAELDARRDTVAAERLERIEAQISKAKRLDKRLRAERARVDTRFDPAEALAGMGRYLEIARVRFGVTDLAVQSYHMGIGNLENVIDRYVQPGDVSGPTNEIVADNELSFARLYFNSSPLRNPRAWALLSGFADESLNYYWKVLAAERIMRLYRDDRGRLERLIDLHAAKATAEEVFHPEDQTEVFADDEALAGALARGDLVRIPNGRRAGFGIGKQLGQLARKLEVERSLYRSLRPEALATLAYLGGQVRAISGAKQPLTVTSAVRDRRYQEALTGVNVEATTKYSLHTTGWSFDILRSYESGKQAQAFQFVLDRLRAQAIIDYAVEPQAIHITVSDEADVLAG